MRPGRIEGIAGLVLATAAAAALTAAHAVGFAASGAEAVFVLLWIVGWVLLAWAGIVGVAGVGALIRAGVARRGVTAIDALLVVATAVVVAGVVMTYPFAGAGSA